MRCNGGVVIVFAASAVRADMTTLLCLNGHSSKSEHDLGTVMKALRALGPVVECNADRARETERLLRESAQPVERIVIGGGDGTINRLLPTLVDAKVPVGIIPLGTANDLARSLDLSLDPDDAATPILEGTTRRIRIAEVNGRPFVNAVGMGLGAALTRNLDGERKKRLGVLAYFATLVEVVNRIPRRVAAVTIDGEQRTIRFLQITIANGIYYGGGMKISEDATLDDGLLRVLCLEHQSFAQLAADVIALRRGVDAEDHYDRMLFFEGREVTVSLPHPIDVTADGELVSKTPVVCKVHPVALDVYAPACVDVGSRTP